MKRILAALATIIIFQQGWAQTIDTAVIRKYDASTVAKLVDWAAATKLSPSQQLRVAAWYYNTDSTLRAQLLSGIPVARIEDREEDNRRYIFNNILNGAQQAEYENHFGKRFGRIAAEGELEYIQEEYHPDELNYARLQKVLADKYGYLYQRFLYAGANDGLAKENVKTILKHYDGYDIYPALYAGKYISGYLNSINAVKEISDTTANRIKAAFTAAVKAGKYTDWGKMLGDITRYYIPDTSLFSALHHDLFLQEALNQCAVDRYNLVHLHHVSVHGYDSVLNLIVQKNYHNAVIRYTYAGIHSKYCDSLINKTTRYYDSAVEASLIRDGSLQPATQFAIALKNKDWLHLRPQLVDSLVSHAMYVSRLRDSVALKNPFANPDTEAYESSVLSDLMSETEYTNLLMLKNQPQALADAKKDWAEIVQRGLAKDLFEDKTVEQLTSYYVMKYSAWNRYAHDKDTQMANMRALDENKPQALKVLDYARWNAPSDKASSALKTKW